MKMKVAAALLCGTVCSSAFSAESESVNKNEDHNSPAMLTPVPIGNVALPAEPWKVQIGAMQETENTEGQGDKDGAYEPTVFVNFSKGKWNFYGAFYQEDHNVDYSEKLAPTLKRVPGVTGLIRSNSICIISLWITQIMRWG